MKRITHKFSYDLSALTEYTQQEVLPLVTKALFDSKTGKLFPKQTGIKFKEVINRMDDEVIFQDGRTCGFAATGNTDFTQRVIPVGSLKINKSWCIDDIEKYWTQIGLTPGSKYDKLPFEAEFSNFYAGLIAEKIEQALWLGDTDSNDNILTHFDGFLKVIDGSGEAITGNTGSEADITSSNVVTIFQRMIAVLPAALQGKNTVSFKCGWDTFRLLIEKLLADNNFHYSTADGNAYQTGELLLPGYDIRVVAVHGLDSTDRIILSEDTNHVIGTDLENEFEQFEFWYSLDDDLMKFRTKFKLGTQVAFPNEIVQYENA